MSNPFFSFIVPVYNIREYIEECIKSLLSQTFSDFEIIIIDDGSTDDSLQICNSIQDSDHRVLVFHQDNQGSSSARNTGINSAKGEYLIFVDGDDLYCNKDALKQIKSIIDKTEVDVISFNRKFLFGDDIIEANDYREEKDITSNYYSGIEELIKTDCFYGSAWVFAIRRLFVLNNNLLFLPGAAVEDIDWIIRMLDIKPTIYNMGEVFYLYRINRDGSLSNSISYESQVKYCSLIEKFASYSYHNEKFRSIILNYIAYQYVLFVALNQMIESSEERKKLQKKEREFKFLLKYDLMRQTKVFHIVSSIIGFGLAEKVMGIMMKKKKNTIRKL